MIYDNREKEISQILKNAEKKSAKYKPMLKRIMTENMEYKQIIESRNSEFETMKEESQLRLVSSFTCLLLCVVSSFLYKMHSTMLKITIVR